MMWRGTLLLDETRSGMYTSDYEAAHDSTSASCDPIARPRNSITNPPAAPAHTPLPLVPQSSSISCTDVSSEHVNDDDEIITYSMIDGTTLVLFRRWSKVHVRNLPSNKTACGNRINIFHDVLVEPTYDFRERFGKTEVAVEDRWWNCCGGLCSTYFESMQAFDGMEIQSFDEYVAIGKCSRSASVGSGTISASSSSRKGTPSVAASTRLSQS